MTEQDAGVTASCRFTRATLATVRRGRTSACLVALAFPVCGGGAQAGDYPIYPIPGTGTVRISIVKKGDRQFFRAPKTVSKGERLVIRNLTNPARVGPHTFTLVEAGGVPRTEGARRRCRLCRLVAAAHRYDAERNRIRRPIVQAGKPGWDKPTGAVGDSWYVERLNDSHSRKVTARVGTKLTFFCGVRPRMTGTIRVVR